MTPKAWVDMAARVLAREQRRPPKHDPDCATRCPYEDSDVKCRILHHCTTCHPTIDADPVFDRFVDDPSPITP